MCAPRLGLVDPADFAKPEMRDNPIFNDQIQMADVLVMNKLDTAPPELVADFQAVGERAVPAKAAWSPARRTAASTRHGST